MTEETTNEKTTTEEVQSTTQEPAAAEVVPKQAYDSVTSDLHKFKQQVREFEKKFQHQETATLKANEEWKTLYESEVQKRELAEEKSHKLENSFVFNKKMDAIKQEAVKQGIHSAALNDLEMMNFDDVQIQKTVREDGMQSVQILGAENAVARLKANKEYLFNKAIPPRTNNSDSEVGNPKEVTIEQVLKAEKDGNTQKYRELLTEYQKQKLKQRS